MKENVDYYSIQEGTRLDSALLDALRCATTMLAQATTGERFYCFALLTTGLSGAPVFAALSEESLDAVAGDDESLRSDLRWSHADSPYYCFADSCFAQVASVFEERQQLSLRDADRETDFRIAAMVRAMRRGDEEGLFGDSRREGRAMINVEVVPPDYTNVARARALNPPEVIVAWLAEAAEPEYGPEVRPDRR